MFADPSGLMFAYAGAAGGGDTQAQEYATIGSYFAGWGDTLSFGATKWGRKWMGEWIMEVGDANDSVDYDSGAYHWGEATGIVHSLVYGGVQGWAKGGAKAAGMEFSHWIPNRFLKAAGKELEEETPGAYKFLTKTFGRSKWNGDYITPDLHAKIDPFRFIAGSTKAQKYSPVVQQLYRIPWVYKGGIVGGGLTGIHDAWTSEFGN